MPASTYTFSHKELAEILIKHEDIHEGLWGIIVEFGLGAANIIAPGSSSDQIVPAAIIPVIKIGIQKFETATSITVDAAAINPRKGNIPQH